MSDFPPVRPFGEWPPIEPQAVDTRDSTVIPDGSIGDAQVDSLSVRKLRGIGIKVYRSSAQTIADAAEDDVDFNTVDFNEGFTAPTGTFSTVTVPYDGVYLLSCTQEWASADDAVFAWLYVNSTKYEGDSRSSDTDALTVRVSLTAVRRLTAGDTVGVRVYQTTGANRDIAAGSSDNTLTVVFLFGI